MSAFYFIHFSSYLYFLPYVLKSSMMRVNLSSINYALQILKLCLQVHKNLRLLYRSVEWIFVLLLLIFLFLESILPDINIAILIFFC